MGYCYAWLGNWELMGKYYQRAVDDGYLTAEIYAGLGYHLFEIGEYEAAMQKLDEALQLKPDLVEAVHALVACELKRAGLEKRPPEHWAAEHIAWAIEQRPTTGQLYGTAASIAGLDAKYKTNEERANAVFGLLETGVEYGLHRHAVKSYSWLLTAQDPVRFEKLVERAPAGADGDTTAYLIPDPGREILEGVLSTGAPR
jgi:tetratricopeptide (TPR) repeat protein